MGWDDRSYYRDRSGATGNRLMWVLNGSVPLFTVFGIRVRAHASLLFLVVLELVLGHWVSGYDIAYRVVSMTMLFLVVLLHEFGHCFSARWMGGSGDDIMLWPLGGLAYADPPHRPWPTFVSVAFGPLVNVLICVVTASLLFFLPPHVAPSFNPFDPLPMHGTVQFGWADPALYLWWMFEISYWLFLFNILPLYPLDGGRMLHTMLWPKLGDRKAMGVTTLIGYPGHALLGILGVLLGFDLLLICIALWGILECRQARIILRETAADEPWGSETPDFSASLFETEKPRRRKGNKRAVRRARKIAQTEAMERSRVDAILAKVSAQGMRSLTWSERRALKKATEHQRQRDLDVLK